MRFKDLREKVGTQEEVAQLINVKQQTIAKYEMGVILPSYPTAKKLAKLFDVNTAELYEMIDAERRVGHEE